MTVFELEDAVVEFCAQNTSDFRLRSNESTTELVSPSVWSGFVSRDEVGAVVPGDITAYPAVIVSAQSGTQDSPTENEMVTVSIIVGCFDPELTQQGYRDCTNVVQRLKDRFREIDIIDERYPVRHPIRWQITGRSNTQTNGFPYYFGELSVAFEMIPAMSSQFEVDIGTGDTTPGRYNATPIPAPTPNAHWLHPTPPPIKWVEHDILKTFLTNDERED